ncbi:GTPase [Sesbania bispinosa]|nr:GTPase [Sesbania bispinosa]
MLREFSQVRKPNTHEKVFPRFEKILRFENIEKQDEEMQEQELESPNRYVENFSKEFEETYTEKEISTEQVLAKNSALKQTKKIPEPEVEKESSPVSEKQHKLPPQLEAQVIQQPSASILAASNEGLKGPRDRHSVLKAQMGKIIDILTSGVNPYLV